MSRVVGGGRTVRRLRRGRPDADQGVSHSVRAADGRVNAAMSSGRRDVETEWRGAAAALSRGQALSGANGIAETRHGDVKDR